MEIIEFTRQFPSRIFQKGEVLISEGQPLDILLALETGFIKVASIDDSGVEHLLWIAAPRDIIPSEHLFSTRIEAQYFYTALTDGNARNIHKSDFLGYTATNKEGMISVAARMSDLSDDLLHRVDATSQQTVRGKLLATLRYLSERFGTNDVFDLHSIGLPLTHLDIAEMIGVTRETTSIELQKLRTNGLIDYSRTSFIIYRDRISEIV